jgi:hypothetical protein
MTDRHGFVAIVHESCPDRPGAEASAGPLAADGGMAAP